MDAGDGGAAGEHAADCPTKKHGAGDGDRLGEGSYYTTPIYNSTTLTCTKAQQTLGARALTNCCVIPYHIEYTPLYTTNSITGRVSTSVLCRNGLRSMMPYV